MNIRVKRVLIVVGSLVALVGGTIGTTAALTGELPSAHVVVENVWARPAIKDGNSAIYFDITNTGDTDVIIVGATGDMAAFVEVHETIHDHDHETHGHVMHMEEVPEIVIRPGETIAFEPAGKHVMLMELYNALKIGDEITFTLHFKGHQPLAIPATVIISLD